MDEDQQGLTLAASQPAKEHEEPERKQKLRKALEEEEGPATEFLPQNASGGSCESIHPHPPTPPASSGEGRHGGLASSGDGR